MFDSVRNNKTVVQVILALIILPFAFWGIDSYFGNGGGNSQVASVGDSAISQAAFREALREQQERLRPTLGGQDPALLESPELRRAVLDNLVQRRLLDLHAREMKLSVNDEQLKSYIMSAPDLQEDGKYSPRLFDMLVASQNKSKTQFEAEIRRTMASQQAIAAVGNASLSGRATADRWLAAQLEEREVSEVVLRAEPFVAQVKLAPDAVKAYYEANTKKFELPEQLRVEYLVLSPATVLSLVQVSASDVQQAFDAATKARGELKSRVESLLNEVRKNPARFAEVAKESSDDTGSKANGGDLGFFNKGAMVKPFEDAAFRMKVGEISGPVESDFGFHIIKLVAIRKGSDGEERQASHILVAKPTGSKFGDQTRTEIEAELKREQANRKFAEIAEGFSNTVYEQPDSLAPAAEKYKLTIETSDWLRKGAAAPGPLANAKLMAALFSDDAIKNKRNTEAVEVAPNVLVSARVREYKPAARQPLETVEPTIAKFLTHQEAARLAAQDGEQKLVRLNKGEKVDLGWSKPHAVTKAMSGELPPDVLPAIFKADAAKVPAYAGVAAPGGYVLFRITQVKRFAVEAGDTPQARALRGEYARLVAEEELAGWIATLRARYPVEIDQAALASKE